jgi:hypothetical protein
MFNFFKKPKYPTWDDIPPLSELPEPSKYPTMPPPTPPRPPQKPVVEFFRVGITDSGMTTLTLISDDHFSVTAHMNDETVRRMIRVLESTLEDKK